MLKTRERIGIYLIPKMEQKQVTSVENIVGLTNLEEKDRLELVQDVLSGNLVLNSDKVVQLLKLISSQTQPKPQEVINQEPRVFNNSIKKLINAMIQYNNMLWIGLSGREIVVSNSDGEMVKSFNAHTRSIFDFVIYNDLLYSCSADNTIKAWNSRYECVQTITDHTDFVMTICTHNDLLVSACYNGTIRLHDKNGKLIKSFKTNHNARINKMISYNGFLYTHDTSGSIKTWDNEFNNSYTLGSNDRIWNENMFIYNNYLVVSEKGGVQFWTNDSKGELFLEKRVNVSQNHTPKICMVNDRLYIVTGTHLFAFKDGEHNNKAVLITDKLDMCAGCVCAFNNMIIIRDEKSDILFATGDIPR